MQWVKLDAVKLIKEGPPKGKEHRHLEMYYEGVLPVPVLSRMSVHKM